MGVGWWWGGVKTEEETHLGYVAGDRRHVAYPHSVLAGYRAYLMSMKQKYITER